MENENGSKASDIIEKYMNRRNGIVEDLTEVINKYSLDNLANIPDHILAEHLTSLIELQISMDVKTREWESKNLDS